VKSRREVVDYLCSAAFCDNGAQVARNTMTEALDIDMASGAPLPTRAQCDALVMGEEVEGGSYEVPELLACRYPAVHALLTEAMT
jgi:hypothetical protein